MDTTIQPDQMLAKELLDKLINHFGVTTSSKDGGYILPNGELLNLNRSNLSAKQYHRAVTELLPEDMRGICDEVTIVNLMVVTGIIRYEATGRVHVAMNPTAAQRSRLFSIMKYRDNDYLVMVSDKTAATIGERRFKSPSAHELLEFFEHCYHDKKQYRVDEFALSKEGEDYILTFRPSQQAIARYDASTKQFTAQPNFEDVLELFRQQIAKSQL
ncbi:MAG: hypothetical protein CENE_02598 [Candidatus Celerinatantimonas neptuna]|nr:MAG: hypothetical protein CENE_02598 [Candidatus Celerinatantimonas neptuna]